ncbi:hypothetical protein [Mucilaginibacter endophyticus]|uniref:hypothetical protein n=1 Tax=Mucilaginibacter endophyticus TaxID=2675003 RepID=UPI000E0DA7CC|nr:hypothetical protein [Mucilaginibacter endophyticus]
MPSREKETPEQKQLMREIAMEVMDTGLRILHNSYLYGSDIWPVNGFHPGGGFGLNVPDRIYYSVNSYGYNQDPIIGRYAFNLYEIIPLDRLEAQVDHLITIFDHTVYNNIYFVNEFKHTKPLDRVWLTFTYLPTKK